MIAKKRYFQIFLIVVMTGLFMSLQVDVMAVNQYKNDRYFVEAIANTTTVRIGDVFRLTITAGAKQGLVKLPGKHIVIAGCQLINYSERDVSRYHEGFIVKQGRYHLRGFTIEHIHIPPIKIGIEWAEGKTEVVSTTPIDMDIHSMKPEPGFSLINPRTPKPLPLPWQQLLLLAGALAGLLWLLLIFKRRRQPTIEHLPAHITAFKNLNLLGESAAVAEGNVQEYFVLLSKCLRRYLEDRFHFPALELPRTAIIEQLGQLGIEAKKRALIDAVLNEADLVKFAMDEVSEDRIAAAHGQVREIIELTKVTQDQPEAGSS